LNVWLATMLQEPRFDDPDRQMPDLGLTAEQATAARDELFRVLRVRVDGGGRWSEYWAAGQRNWRPLLAGGAAGIVFVLAILGLIASSRRAGRRRRRLPARGWSRKGSPPSRARCLVSLTRSTSTSSPRKSTRLTL